jgi:hypothetical protein
MAVLTSIQTAIKAKLETLEYFTGVKVFTEQLADVEQALQIELEEASGLAVIVLTPGADVNHPNLPGPYFDNVRVVVQVVEHVTLNQGAGGTRKAAADVAETVSAHLKGFGWGSATDGDGNPVTAHLEPMTEHLRALAGNDGLVRYNVAFRTHGGLEII